MLKDVFSISAYYVAYKKNSSLDWNVEVRLEIKHAWANMISMNKIYRFEK